MNVFGPSVRDRCMSRPEGYSCSHSLLSVVPEHDIGVKVIEEMRLGLLYSCYPEVSPLAE